MNRFVQHHQDLIHFSYSCFDRILCQGMLLQFQHSKRAATVAWFLRRYRQAGDLNKAYFSKLARDYHNWLIIHAQQTGVPIVQPEKDVRREEWVEPYYQQLGAHPGIAVILKCREPERIVIANKTNDLSVASRFVYLYYFYLNDPQYGRMFLRICPYFPFNVRLWMNGHNWLACRLQQEGIAFTQRENLFVDCANPHRLQALADGFGPDDLRNAVAPWLRRLLPFFSEAERQQGFVHQLFMTQMEYCHNLVFHQQAAAHRILDRLLDANRALGHPDKLAAIFARRCFHADTRTGQTVVRMTKSRTAVISSSYSKTSIKQYVSHNVALRTESTSCQLKELGVNKNVDNLPALRTIMATANERYENAQQDILATYVDRDQLQQLRQPSISASGRRVPGLHVDDPRLLAVLQALVCFSYLAGRGCFRTKDLLTDVQKALDCPEYRLSQLRYDLTKLRGKGLLHRLTKTQAYQLTPDGYRLAILYLKLYHRLYAPLTAGIRDPIASDNRVLSHRQTKLDRLYSAVDEALQKLTDFIGLTAA
jgi:hypothetical protein